MCSRQAFRVTAAYVARFVAIFLLVAKPLHSQSSGRTAIIQQLRSRDWAKRAEAFETLSADSSAFATPSMAAELLHLLETEDELIASTIRESHGRVGVSDKYGEEFGEYRSDVFDACLKRCDKSGLVRLLLQNARPGSETRGSSLELIAVVFDRGFSGEQRDQLAGALISGAGDTSYFNRFFSLRAIDRVVPTTLLSSRRRQEMRQAVIANVGGGPTDIRVWAVRLLGAFRDPQDRALLSGIAVNDTARSVNHGKVSYPVRDEALKALEKLPHP